MAKAISIDEMRKVETAANNAGVTYAQMMLNAGRGVAEVVIREFIRLKSKNAIGLVGKGNNGGDALVALTILNRVGWRTKAYLTSARFPGDLLLEEFLSSGGQVMTADADKGYLVIGEWLAESEVLLDGILGTGFKLPFSQELDELMRFISMRIGNIHVVAIDCPSGVDCDKGIMEESVLTAEITVCMQAVKIGLLRFPAFHKVGRLEVVPIGLPKDLVEWEAIRGEMVDEERAKGLLPFRSLDGHKGSFGTVMIVGGSENYCGAVGLAALGAYRMGCGLVRIAAIDKLIMALAGRLLEATWIQLPNQEGGIAFEGVDLVIKNLARTDVLLLGPGMGTTGSSAQFVEGLFDDIYHTESSQHVVIDADGLRLITKLPAWHNLIPAQTILTPHPGEFSAMTGLSVEEIQANRLEFAKKFSVQWGHVVILKGAMSIVAAPDGRWAIIPVATSALAKAGTGDVLAGMVASLRAQGLGAYDAAITAAWIHARAGVLAEHRIGNPASVMAHDVVESIQGVVGGLI